MLSFVDTNKELVKKVKKLFDNYRGTRELDTFCWDVFEYKKLHPEFKIATASNPQFTMWAGLDKAIAETYPQEIGQLREFWITDNLFWLVSVDENIKTDRARIRRCLAGVYAYRCTINIILTGIWTGIWWLSEEDFISELSKMLSANLSSADLRSADLSSANLRSADLGSADLGYANLSSADLHSANLSSANLRSANLSCANLSSANLRDADLRSTDLSSANLCYANLSYANLHSANLISADLRYANLSSADLRHANLRYADLRDADLRSADLSYADLSSADLRDAHLSYVKYNQWTAFLAMQCPEEGAFIGWKKLEDWLIAKLQRPARAKRSSATSRKCRAEYVKTLWIWNGNERVTEWASQLDTDIKYTVWEITHCEKRDEDRRNECSWGIHFFLTRWEAEQW